MPILDVVLTAETVRGSIVNMRKDLQDARAFAAEGKARTVYSEEASTTSMPYSGACAVGPLTAASSGV